MDSDERRYWRLKRIFPHTANLSEVPQEIDMTEEGRNFGRLGNEADLSSSAGEAEEKKQFTEPKLTFIEPKLVTHGSPARSTGGTTISITIPGTS